MHHPSWNNKKILYVLLVAVFISMFLSTYALKMHINKKNLSNGHYLATLVEDNPIYNQASYREDKVAKELSESELLHYGQMVFDESQQPTVVRLLQPEKLAASANHPKGHLEEVDFYISQKQQVLWYVLTYPLNATFKEKLTEIFDLKVDFQANLKESVVYADVKVKPDVKPATFMGYLPALHDLLLEEFNSKEKLRLQMHLHSDAGEYLYDRSFQNRLIYIQPVESTDQSQTENNEA